LKHSLGLIYSFDAKKRVTLPFDYCKLSVKTERFVAHGRIFNKTLYANTNISCKHATLKDGFGSNLAGSQLAYSPEWLFNAGVTYKATTCLVANLPPIESAYCASIAYCRFLEEDENV